MQKNSQLKISGRQLISLLAIVFLAFGWGRGGKDGISYLLFSLAFLTLGVMIFTTKRQASNKVNRLSIILGSFILISSLSFFWSANKYQTIIGIIVIFLAGLLYLVSLNFFNEKKMFDIWLPLFISASSIFAIFGLPIYFLDKLDGRFTSLIGWPNATAAYLIIPIFLSIYGFIKSRSNKSYLYLVSLAILISSFVLTFSRAAYFVLVIFFVPILIIKYKDTKLLKSFAIAVAAGFLLAGLFYWARGALLNNKVNLNVSSSGQESKELLNSSAVDRKNYWLSSISIYKDNPILGTGLGTFSSVYPRYQRTARAETNYPHSYLIGSLAELGVLGFTAVFAIYIYILFIAYKNRRNDKLLIFSLAALAVMSHAFIDTDFSYPSIIFSLIILMSIIALEAKDKITIKKLKTEHIKYLKLALVLSSIAFGILSFLYCGYKSSSDSIALADGISNPELLEMYKNANKNILVDPNSYTEQAELMLNNMSGKTDSEKIEVIKNAELLVRKSIDQNPNNGQSYFVLAEINLLNSDIKSSEANLLKSIEKDPYNNPAAYIAYVDLLNKNSEYQKSLEYLNKILLQYDKKTISDKSVYYPKISLIVSDLYTQKAIILIQGNDIENAKSAISSALILNPKNILALKLNETLNNK